MLAVVVPAGVVVGALLDLLMFLLARYGPHADSWSFRGNGALAVLALVPAALAAGWTMIVAHGRPDRRRSRPFATLALDGHRSSARGRPAPRASLPSCSARAGGGPGGAAAG